MSRTAGLRRVAGRFAVFLLLLVAALVAAPAASRAVNVERVVSPGGIEAWLVRDPTIPVISVHLAFRDGAALDPGGKLGLATMVSGLLDEGAGDLDSEAFQGRLNDLAIQLGFDAGLDYFTGSLKTLKENRDTAFDMLRLALTSPRFDAEPIERIRNQVLTILARNAEDPGRIAAETWYRTVFPDHPYGRPVDGTPDSIHAIAAADLHRFVKERLARDNLMIGVVGDITPEELAPLLDKTFGALPAHAGPDTVPEVKPKGAGEFVVIDRDIPQSVVFFGEAGVKRDDPDYYAAYIMNYILGGGGFSSRLTQEVREKRGLAYSVYTYLNPLEHAGLISGGVATRNGKVKDSIEIIRGEWQRLRDRGVTDAELKDAKSYLTGSFPLRLDTTDKIAQTLVAIQMDRLGIDYLDKRNALIEGVTQKDIERVAQRLIDTQALAFVVVGKPDGVSSAGAPAPAPPQPQGPPENPM
ncbi:MAG TPA: pitrilysin family protein [Alphaproteobacteria bacterium]|nr:pitrilysin family protein [Alphaproteobacteria bacterium]